MLLKERFDADENFKKQAQLTVVKLQSGDATCMQLWKLLCDISRKEFEKVNLINIYIFISKTSGVNFLFHRSYVVLKVYERLGVVVEERGESFYNDRIPGVVDKLVETGIVSDDGGTSRCIFLNDIPFGCCGVGSSTRATVIRQISLYRYLCCCSSYTSDFDFDLKKKKCCYYMQVKRQVVNYPLFLRKSDGGYGYDSTDMTAIYHRLFEMDVDWVVYVTDKRQVK
jgi:arginyl-tRNA synthetase